ncbi:uncharacterized protein APUU_11761S [Aspergillus puulaauensis]|uniref:Myb-like DNA-binding domain-containing protein n=1 Tax=Aspergillus puulaauensis TaxID=1220207 RepID=A0A7R7XDA3_9EURO|nr:uncharacterized protein APUU_11761S [Aspergillus puulaauensis]BCS18933.1 hypothetical protein APUU_11761S [Aspergillus puulaauensis]
MASNIDSNNTNNPDEPASQDVRFGFECLRNIKDGKVDLSGVGEALGYTNVNSVGNRFRRMRDKYGFTGLECTNGNGMTMKEKPASPKKEADGTGTPAKRRPGRPPKNAGLRKGAKVSTADLIPATGPVAKNGDGTEEGDNDD